MTHTSDTSRDSLNRIPDELLDQLLVDRLAGREHIPEPRGALRSLEQLHARLATLDDRKTTVRRPFRAPSWWRPQRYIHEFAVAAVAATVVALVLTGSYIHSSASSDSPTGAARYSTAPRQRAVISLPDGSQITLAPSTTLLIESGFGEQTRRVGIDGEAYFHIRDATSTPFIVSTPRATTRVLGTTFTMREYPTDLTTHVAVTSGKVSVAAKERGEAILTAGMVAVVADSGIRTARPADFAPYVGWINDRLVFRDVPIPDVFDALERWYGYRFRLADSSWMSKRVTLWLSADSSAAALRSLAFVLNADTHVDSNVVILSPKRRNTPQAPPRREVFYSPYAEVGR